MADTSKFYNKKTGPVVIMGNGPSLNDIPDTFLRRFPTFGCNLIHLRSGFVPTYYAVADDFLVGDVWEVIANRFRQIPKFLLDTMPTADKWIGENFYTYHRRQGPVWLNPKELHPGYLDSPGVSFRGIVHAMIQMALFMGHKKFYLVGCDNTKFGEHFYQEQLTDEYLVEPDQWEWAFDTLQTCILPKPIINLSTRGKIECLAWADWKNL